MEALTRRTMFPFISPAAGRHPGKLNGEGSSGVPETLLGRTSAIPILFAFLLLATCALGANSVVNMSHYDLMRPDFAGMAKEGVAGVIHEATYRLERDARYSERQRAALEAGLLWGAYHFGDAINPIGQADHFLNAVAAAQPPIRAGDPEKRRSGVLLVLDFEKYGHHRGRSMSVAQAVTFVERIKARTGKYPGLYGSEYRLRQMLYGRGATSVHRQILTNCWLWIANYHAEPRNPAPWSAWHMWQYCGDGRCDLRPRSMFPKSVANVRKAERNIFRGDNVTLQVFWRENAWYPSG